MSHLVEELVLGQVAYGSGSALKKNNNHKTNMIPVNPDAPYCV